jgi:peroxiredoxin-like protein
MPHTLPYFYETEVAWTGERKGELKAPGLEILEVATPPEFNGHEGIWSPEHYFVASVNACFMTTFLAIAEMSKLAFLQFSCKARGKLDKVEGVGFQMTEIELRPKLVIRNGRDLERAGRILEKAERNCLITNSIKSVVKMESEVAVAKE